MKGLPYFHWYPADAETDANFRAMSDAEIGFYIRCLNHAWINGGIPADQKERARVLHTRLDTANKYWVRVGKCFEPAPTTDTFCTFLHNKRQEIERGLASRKSQLASVAAKIGSERRASAQQSESESESYKDKPLSGGKEIDVEAQDKPFALSSGEPSMVRPDVPTFEDFWKVWWNHSGKADAKKAWPAVAREHGEAFLIEQCVVARKRFESSDSWKWRANMLPATWLRGKRWEDQLPPDGKPIPPPIPKIDPSKMMPLDTYPVEKKA